MNRLALLIGAATLAAIGLVAWQMMRPAVKDPDQSITQPDSSSGAGGDAIVEVRLPSELSPEAEIGKRGFEAKCAECHGDNAAGRNGKGPPLVHKIYEPSHHGDQAFLLAVQNGARAHHWKFGNMPPVEGVTRADVLSITRYVRELQQANGIN